MSALSRAVSRSLAPTSEPPAPNKNTFSTSPHKSLTDVQGPSPKNESTVELTRSSPLPSVEPPNPLIALGIDLANIERAERQLRTLLRSNQQASAQNAVTNASQKNANVTGSMGNVSAPGAKGSAQISNPASMTASPTTKVPFPPTEGSSLPQASSFFAPSPAAFPPQPTDTISPSVRVLTQLERESLVAAWDKFSKPIKLLHGAIKAPLKLLVLGYEDMTSCAPLTAARKAELLSELCAAAEKLTLSPSITLHGGSSATSHLAPSSPASNIVTIPVPFLPPRDTDSCVSVILDALDSPSLVIRLLGLHGAKFFCHDNVFFERFLKQRGFYFVASAIDGEHPHESDYALTLVHNITRLKLKGTLKEHLPYYIASRVVSCIDPLDQRAAAQSSTASSTPGMIGGVTFAQKSRCLDILQLMLKAYPEEMSEADAIRPMLLACLNPATPKEEMERVVVALLEAFDDPKRRCFIRDSDIGVIFTPFTDHSFREGTMITQASNQPSAINSSLGLAASSSNMGTVTGRARDMICKFLSSWSGMLWLSTETAGIRSLIDALHLPGRVELKLSLIALFNQAIRRMAPHRGIPAQGPWDGANGRGRKGTVMNGGGVADDYDLVEFEDGAGISDSSYYEYLIGVNEGVVGGFRAGAGEGGGDDYAPITSSVGYHACDVFLGCLLLVLNHHGLPDALIAVMRIAAQRDDSSGNSSGGSSGDSMEMADYKTSGRRLHADPATDDGTEASQPVSLLREAALLLQHIIVLMDTLLPRATASKLHGSLNEAISSMAADGRSFAGGLTNTLYHNFRGSGAPSIYSSGVVGLGGAGKGAGLGFAVSAMGAPGNGDVDNSDAAFYALIRESCVLESNGTSIGESSRLWNPVAILTLIEGPLKNSIRLRYVRDRSPFLQRLLSFYKLTVGGSSHHNAALVANNPQSSVAFGQADSSYGLTLTNFNQPMARHHTTLSGAQDGRFRWTAIGVALSDLLLSSRDGVDALTKADFATGFRSLFDDVLSYYQQQLRKSGGNALHTRLSSLLSRESIQEGTGIDILKILARFTLCANGLNILKRNGIFDKILGIFQLVADATVLSAVSDGGSRASAHSLNTPAKKSQAVFSSSATSNSSYYFSDLCVLCSKILQYSYVGSVPNFGVCEEFRQMMLIALSPSVEDFTLKNAAIDQLARVIWRDLGGSLEWGIGRLLLLLDDLNRSIVSRAYKLLSNICFSSAQALENLIAKQPRALLENKQLIDQRRMLNINALLYRMVGHPKGFAFLQGMGWVSKELEYWSTQGALLFVDDLQQVIARAGSDTNLAGGTTGGAATPRGGVNRHYRTPSNFQNYRQAVTTVTSSMQVAHSIYPDHVVKGLCSHREGCEAFSNSRLWTESIHTLMKGVSRRCNTETPTRRKSAGNTLENDITSSDDDSVTSDENEEGSERLTRQAAAAASDAAIAARRRRSVVDTSASISAALKLHAQKATANLRMAAVGGSSGGYGSSSLIHMLRREAIAEDIDEVLEYEGGAAEIQFQNNQNHKGGRGHYSHHGTATYIHAGTAGLNTVTNYRKNKKKGDAALVEEGSSSDDEREFSAARGYGSKYATRMVELTVEPKALAAAMYVLAFAGSSDYGFELLIRADGTYPPYALLHTFVEISRYAINPFVRGTALTCLSIICRSSLAMNYLTTAYNCSVLNEISAYVTPTGVPYSVSFLQPHLIQWMLVGRSSAYLNSGSRHIGQGASAYISHKAPPSTKNVPKDIQEFMMMLLNPVSREKAKGPLVALMKEKPSLVVGNAAVRYMRECSCIYRMRHAERKFLADLFAKVRIVRYTHKREKKERDPAQQALLLQGQQLHAAQQQQTQNSSSFAGVAVTSSPHLSQQQQQSNSSTQTTEASNTTPMQFPGQLIQNSSFQRPISKAANTDSNRKERPTEIGDDI